MPGGRFKQKSCALVDMIIDNSYCNPYDWASGKTKIKRNTVSIHHYAGTWMDEGAKKNNIERHNYEKIKKKYGVRIANLYSILFWAKKENGGKGIFKTVLGRMFKGKNN